MGKGGPGVLTTAICQEKEQENWTLNTKLGNH